ncbi:methylated-DNA--[protein]-cysteine S-methyltransferase [Rasiella rasia]|uniref:Methylated-DNA--protein-cysteine methyltransferase n=1 Tax=Rasiella rasia TaxID=2744027 RepID=A0A6G6GN70_9FLAO|nr:methylated-DNA--[protein]-cysteine S-methyltransferase [Rasiella rasia]QIE59974.1 methylated-DNA--[protein]-cysteine S-methyltransferase [Rasiella rasia]
MEIAHLQTPIGMLEIKGDSNGVSAISFLDETELDHKSVPKSLQIAVRELEEYFSKTRTQFSFQLNPQGTDFQKKVWNELLSIPFGKTTSYQQMANQLGDPKVIRAAASANGKNPVAIVVPCHRVIGSDGSLTGYAGGLHRKKWLLDHESPVTQGSLF